MTKRIVTTPNAPAPAGAYSQAIVVEGNGKVVFAAGTLPLDPVTGKVSGETIEEQTEQVLRNIEAILKEAGASLTDVVKVTVHLDDVRRFSGFNSVYEKFFSGPKPARTTVGSQLGLDVMVEIDVIAAV
jgi:reactive intermediate/imine deaminase